LYETDTEFCTVLA